MSQSAYEEILGKLLKSRSLGEGYELREVQRWTVNCSHCGVQLVGDTPTTEKAFQALRRLLEGRKCRNQSCVSNGGTEKKR